MPDQPRIDINVNDALTSLDKVSEAYKSVGIEAERLDDKAREAMSGVSDSAKKANTELTKQQQLIKRLENEYNRLEKEIEEATDVKEIRRLNNEIEATGRTLAQVKQRAKGTFDTIKKESKSAEQQVSKLGKTIGIAFAVTTVTAFVAAIKNLTDSTNKAERSVRGFFNATGEELTELTKQSLLLANTQEEDLTRVNLAVKNLQNTYKDKGLTAEAAFALVDKSIEKGSNVRQELFELLREYPAQFRAVGLAADEALAFITQSEQEGFFSDKGLDAIKEAGERLGRFEKPAVEAIKALGLPAEALINEVQRGEKTIFDLIQLTAAEIDKLGETSVIGRRALEGIFGTQAVDAGQGYLKFLGEVNLELDELEDKTTDLDKATKEFNEAWIDLTVTGTKSGSVFNQIYVGVLKFAASALRGIKQLGLALEPLFNVFRRINQSVVNIFGRIRDLIGRFVDLEDSGDRLSQVFNSVVKVFAFFGDIIADAVDFFGKFIDAIADFIEQSPILSAAVDGIFKAFNFAVQALIDLPAVLAGSREALKVGLASFRQQFLNTFKGLGSIINAALSFDSDKLQQALDNYKKVVVTESGSIGGKMKEAFQRGFNESKFEVEEETNNEIEEELDKNFLPNLEPIAEGKAQRFAKAFQLKLKEEFDNIPDLIAEALENEIPQPDLNFQQVELSFRDKILSFLRSDDFEEAKRLGGELINFFNDVANANLKAAEAQVDAKQRQVDELQTQLETELQLNEQGFASSVALKQEELEAAQKQEEEALKQKEEAQKAQERIDNAQQISAIVTSIANLIQQWSSLGPFGYAAGLTQVGLLLAGYISSKQKAQKLREGATGLREGLIDGPSHEGGGVPFEVEGGEYHSITPKAKAKKYLPLLEAIRTDDQKAIRNNLIHFLNPEDLSSLFLPGLEIPQAKKGIDYRSYLKDIQKSLKHRESASQISYEGGYKIIRKGNVTKRIKLNG